MMKKIFNLMVGAAVFTTSPLFAMDESDPFRAAYMSPKNQDNQQEVEITPNQLNFMSSLRSPQGPDAVDYFFFHGMQPYKLHVCCLRSFAEDEAKTISPEDRLKAFIEADQNITFTRDVRSPEVEALWDLVYPNPLPIVFSDIQDDFYMVVRTNYNY